MARFIKDRSSAKGQAPGSLILIGNQKMDAAQIHVMQYNAESLLEEEVPSIEEAYIHVKPKHVTWINIYGIHDLETIKRIGEFFNIHSLILEDTLNTDQRPKYVDDDKNDAFILKMLHQDINTKRIISEQISIFLGEHYVLTLQEQKGDVFAPIRERIRNSKGKIRLKDNDYLAYSLMDTIADNYTILIEALGSRVEDLEDRIFGANDNKIAEELYTCKIELNFFRKAIRPVKDVMISVFKSENSYFKEETGKYLKDLNELIIQSTDAIELYNNIATDQLNIYNTNVSNRMNEVMKVLTIFASIFIPLTFLAGIYGMNFEYIPELGFKYSYLIFWIVVVMVGVGLLLHFRRKKWL